jgi:hypothetical protein
MSTLYDITGEFLELYELMTDPDCDEDAIQGSLESLVGELEVKAGGYSKVIKTLEMEQKAAEDVAKAFTEKATVRKNHIKRMKDALLHAMDVAGLNQVAAGDFTIRIQKNGGKEPLKITGDVPDNMMRVIMEPDNDRIREYLSEHEADWAHLEERGRHIVIK